MKKKGLIYRMTMMFGPVLILGGTSYEMAYSYYYKTTRNTEIEREKNREKVLKEIEGDGSEDEMGVLNSRDKYKEDRLKKIK